jgi:hypothetical protein
MTWSCYFWLLLAVTSYIVSRFFRSIAPYVLCTDNCEFQTLFRCFFGGFTNVSVCLFLFVLFFESAFTVRCFYGYRRMCTCFSALYNFVHNSVYFKGVSLPSCQLEDKVAIIARYDVHGPNCRRVVALKVYHSNIEYRTD